MQRVLVVHCQRRHHRDLAAPPDHSQRRALPESRHRSSARVDKISPPRRAVLQPHLIDAVLVTVERQQAAIAARPRLSTASSTVSGVRAAKAWVCMAALYGKQAATCVVHKSYFHLAPAVRGSTNDWNDSLYWVAGYARLYFFLIRIGGNMNKVMTALTDGRCPGCTPFAASAKTAQQEQNGHSATRKPKPSR